MKFGFRTTIDTGQVSKDSQKLFRYLRTHIDDLLAARQKSGKQYLSWEGRKRIDGPSGKVQIDCSVSVFQRPGSYGVGVRFSKYPGAEELFALLKQHYGPEGRGFRYVTGNPDSSMWDYTVTLS